MLDFLASSRPERLRHFHAAASAMIVVVIFTCALFGMTLGGTSPAIFLPRDRSLPPMNEAHRLAGSGPTAVPVGVDFVGLGRTYTRWALGGHADSLAPAMTPAGLNAMLGVKGIAAQLRLLGDFAGKESKLVREVLTRVGDTTTFIHVGKFTKYREGVLAILWNFDRRYQLASFVFHGPPSQP